MRALHFDCETTGLPVSGAPSNDPRHPKIVTISAILDDAEGNEVMCLDHIIKPHGWAIDEGGEAFRVHGITQARAEAEGVPLDAAMSLFCEFAGQADVLVSFNFFFDWKMLKISCAQLGEPGAAMRAFFEGKQSICTMEGAAQHLLGKRRIKLSEAHQQLFGEPNPGHHASMPDTLASRRIFHRLKELGAMPAPKSMAPPVYATPLPEAANG